MAILLDGKKISERILCELREKVQKASGRIEPRLGIILVGNDPASVLYTSMKHRRAVEAGIAADIHRFPENASEAEVLAKISELNDDKAVSGMLVQLPLPGHLAPRRILDAISPVKDADGLTSESFGRAAAGDEDAAPATPRAIMRLLDEYGIECRGKYAVIVSRSALIGKPLAMMLLGRGATVTVCHRSTKDLAFHTCRADLLVSAAGTPGLITGSMVKPGAVVIDAGISTAGGKAVGDVLFEEVRQKASHITPVPGGVGPMTIACLLERVVG